MNTVFVKNNRAEAFTEPVAMVDLTAAQLECTQIFIPPVGIPSNTHVDFNGGPIAWFTVYENDGVTPIGAVPIYGTPH